ncbi:hypothetical protein ACROYT_G038070 [Oculina patagonica]
MEPIRLKPLNDLQLYWDLDRRFMLDIRLQVDRLLNCALQKTMPPELPGATHSLSPPLPSSCGFERAHGHYKEAFPCPVTAELSEASRLLSPALRKPKAGSSPGHISKQSLRGNKPKS